MLCFEWDPRKAATNLQKHGVDFETATRVFDDPFLLSYFDRVENGEERWQAIGSIEGILMVLVVHTIREDYEEDQQVEIVRIISAREADRKERHRYEEETR